MSEGSWVPKTWPEAIPYIVWGILTFAFGFEGVGALIHGEWWSAIFGFVGMLWLSAMLIHWAVVKQTFGNVRWLVGAMMLAMVIVVLSPFVEQRRWPYSSVFHDPPTANDIAKAAGEELTILRTERDSLQKQLSADTSNEPSKTTAKSEEVATLISQRDQAIKERDEARTAISSRAPGELPIETGEIAALEILHSNSFSEEIAHSKNIKSVKIEYSNNYILKISCANKCIKLTIVFDNKYGPFDVWIKRVDWSSFSIGRPKPVVAITHNSDTYVEIVVGEDSNFIPVFGEDGLHELRVSVGKAS